MMKKFTAALLVLTLMFAFASCGEEKGNEPGSLTPDDIIKTNSDDDYVPPEATTKQADALPGSSLDTGMKEKLSPVEYSAYIDLFYNKNTEPYDGRTFTKDGVYTKIYDAFNKVERYYVWGYADRTKCCDYQWEFVPADPASLPEPGSYIKVKGKMTADEAALDKHWLTEAEVKVTDKFANAGFDYDMTTMSSTLARVQIQNMVMFPDVFDGKTVRIFCRALSPKTAQHPYYDGAWELDFTESSVVPKIGEYMLLEGTFSGDKEVQKIETSKITLVA